MKDLCFESTPLAGPADFCQFVRIYNANISSAELEDTLLFKLFQKFDNAFYRDGCKIGDILARKAFEYVLFKKGFGGKIDY